jgi:thiol-disulfide isomerase/thioredoxin
VVALTLGLAALAMACSPAATPTATQTPTVAPAMEPAAMPTESDDMTGPEMEGPDLDATATALAGFARTGRELPAPAITGISNWINSEPFTLIEQQQQGNVVLIDFWTYTCINCIRTLPYLRQWHDKYADQGLVILGVHTPEFEFEKDTGNVTKAMEDFGVGWPVAQDNDFGTWNAFGNRFWPAKYLIDANGIIRYTHFGEGSYDETEQWIRAMLTEAGRDVSAIEAGIDPGPAVDQRAASAVTNESATTRELYAGHERNLGALIGRSQPPYILQDEYYDNRDEEATYTDPGDHQNHYLYIQGVWRNHAEYIAHARTTQNLEDYIAVKFNGTSVNAVMAPVNGGSFDVYLTLDGAPLPREKAGLDVMFDDSGQSYIHVDEERMYFVVSQPEFSGHELKLSSNSDEFSLFAFTFGSYVDGEVDPGLTNEPATGM